MPDQPEKNAIKQARKALELARDVDDQDFLSQLLTRIAKGETEPEGEEVSFPDQLEEYALSFESEHPRLAGAIREVLDALQRMGI